MMKCLLLLPVGAVLFLVLAVAAHADSIPNPDPGTFIPVDPDSGLFTPNDALFTLRLADFGDANGLSAARFGFYFEGSDVTDPGNLHTIFSAADLPGATAAIDFLGGVVFETPAFVVKDTFTPSAANIGFFLQPDPVVSFFLFGGAETIFTQETLNPLEQDFVGTFQVIGDPQAILLSFAGRDEAGEWVPVNYELLDGLDVVQVPEPTSVALLACGLLGLGVMGRRRMRCSVAPRSL